jgi:hypothetical protein
MSQTTKVTITMRRRDGGLWETGQRALRYYEGEVVNQTWPTGYVFAEVTMSDVMTHIHDVCPASLVPSTRNLIKEAIKEARKTGRAEFEI